MSRTIRNVPLQVEWNPWAQRFERWFARGYFRHPKTLNTKKQEASAAQALRDEGYYVAPRHSARANPAYLPSTYDDLHISAYDEIDYNDGQVFKWP